MQKNTFTVTDYSILVGMLAVSCGIGVFYAWKDRRQKSNANYLVGDRQLAVVPVALSLMASFLSSNTVLGYPAEIYIYGMHFAYTVLAVMVSIVISAEVFLPLFYKLQLISVNEYLKQRFDSQFLRTLVSAISIIFSLPYLGVVLYGPSLTLSSVTDLSVSTSILTVGIICTLYTTLGGIKAVVWTDVVQVILLLAGLLAVIIQGSSAVGGLTKVWQIGSAGGRTQITNFQFDFYAPNTVWNVFLGMGILWTGAYATSQMQVQRYCSLPSLRRAKLALYLNVFGVAVCVTAACLCGLVIYANYKDCDPLKIGGIHKADQIMPYFVLDIFGDIPGLTGLFVASVFSGSLSTLSSGFAAMAALIWDDLLKNRLKISEASALWVTKLIAAAIGVTVIGVAFLVGLIGSVIQAGVSLSGTMFSNIFGVYLAGACFPFANSKGVSIGLLVGTGISFWAVIGSLFYPFAMPFLPTSTLACQNETIHHSHLLTSLDHHFRHERTGLEYLYHIHYLWMPVLGFIITFATSLLFSILTGGNKKPLNPDLMVPFVSYFYKDSEKNKGDVADITTKKQPYLVNAVSYKQT